MRVSSSSRRGSIVLSSAVAGIILTIGSPLLGQTASAIIREGEAAAGAGITVLNVDTPNTNGIGGYGFYTTNSDSIHRIFGNATGGPRGVLFFRQNFGQYNHTGWENNWGLSDTGQIGYSPTVTDTVSGATGLDAIWRDGTKVVQEGEPLASIPGQNTIFGSDPGITHDGKPYWLGGFGPAAATTNRAFFMGMGATPLIKGGDVVAGSGGLTLKTSNSPFGNRVSALGTNYIINHEYAAPAVAANDSFILVSGSQFMAGGSPMREGTVVPVAVGGNGVETWSAWDAPAVAEDGTVFVTGDTTAATTADEFVFVRDTIVMREGAAIATPIGAGVISGDIEWGDMNESRDWAVSWDATVGGTNYEALMVNGQCVFIETQLVDWNGDGVIDGADNNGKLFDFTGTRSFAVSERYGGGSFFDVFFTADIDFLGTVSNADDLEGGFKITITVPEPSSLAVVGLASLGILRRRNRRK